MMSNDQFVVVPSSAEYHGGPALGIFSSYHQARCRALSLLRQGTLCRVEKYLPLQHLLKRAKETTHHPYLFDIYAYLD